MKRLLEMEIALSSPWAEEARKAHDEIERLTAVLDAAREMAVKLRRHAIKPDAGDYEQGTAMAASEILRVLGGEVKL